MYSGLIRNIDCRKHAMFLSRKHLASNFLIKIRKINALLSEYHWFELKQKRKQKRTETLYSYLYALSEQQSDLHVEGCLNVGKPAVVII